MYLPEPGLYLDGVSSNDDEYRHWIIFPGTVDNDGFLHFISLPIREDSETCISAGLYHSGCSPDSIRATDATLIKKLDKLPTIKELQAEFPELFI